MADGPALALQKALIATLRSDAGLTALVGARVYDEPPERVQRPYARLGNLDLAPFRTAGKVAWSVTFSIEGHSRPKQGRVQAARIAQAAITALDQQHAGISVTGFRLAWVEFVTATTVRASDGKSYQSNAAFDAVLDVTA